MSGKIGQKILSVITALILIVILYAPFYQSSTIKKTLAVNPPGWSDDIRLTNSISPDANQAIAAYQENVHIVWRDIWLGNGRVFYTNSTDGGQVWNTQTQLNIGGNGNNPDIAINASNLHIVYDETVGVISREIAYSKSIDGGISWNSPKFISGDDGVNSQGPRIFVNGSNIHISWMDLRDGNDGEIYYRRSLDGGAAFDNGRGVDADRRITFSPAAITQTRMAGYGSNISVVWSDMRNGNWDIYWMISKNNGADWEDGQGMADVGRRISDDPASSGPAAVAMSGPNIHIVWVDMETPGPIYRLYYRNSTDSGASWSIPQLLIGPQSLISNPFITCQENEVNIVWADKRDGLTKAEIYYKNSTDGGISWSSDLRQTYNESFDSWMPKIALSGNMKHVAWYDARDGNDEIYYKRHPDFSATDTMPTEIYHDAIASANISQPINITANVTDDVGVDSVFLNYTSVNATNHNVSMNRWGDNFSYDIPGQNNIGVIDYFIWANDTSGNANMTTVYHTQINDVTDPEINHIPVVSSNVGDAINITANITDNIGVETVYLNYTGINAINYNVSMTQWNGNWSYDIPGQNNIGNVQYFIWANDTSGNANMTSVYSIPIYDVTAPVINHLPVISANVFNVINITANIIDDVAVYEVFLDYTGVNGTHSNMSMNKWDGNYSFNIPGQTSTGIVEYFIWANDTSDNDNMTLVKQIQIYDITKPEINHVPVISKNIGESINITANITDDVAVNKVFLNYTDVHGVNQNITMKKWNGNYSFEIPNQSNSGLVDYFIWANDSSDNDNMTQTYQIQIFDITDPDINHNPITSANVSISINITANVTDDVSVNSVYLNWTGVNGTNYNVSMSKWCENYSYEIPGQDTIGTVQYFIWANDSNRNDNRTIEYSIQINDVVKPVINHVPVLSANVGDATNITVNITDDVGVNKVYLNYTDVEGDNYNVSMNKYNYNWSYDLPGQNNIGIVEYFIWANDTSGNDNQTQVFQIQINDITKPDIEHMPITSVNISVAINITATITDDVEIDSVYLNYTDIDGVNHNVSMDQWNGNWSYDIPGQLSKGNLTYFVWANDTSGNANQTDIYQVQINETIIPDSTPPTIISKTPTGINVSISTIITITFNESMDTSSVQNAITISPAVDISSYNWNADNTTLTVIPSGNMSYNTTYNVAVEIGAKDIAGNNLASVYSWEFTTKLQPVVNNPDGGIGEYWWIIIIIVAATMIGVFFYWQSRKNGDEEEPEDEKLS